MAGRALFAGYPRYELCTGPGGGGTPYVMGDTYVPRFWPPFFTLAGSNTIFLGYFSHPPTAKLSFGVQKLPIFTKIDLFGPKFNFFLDLFGSNFQRPAAHPHQFSGRVPSPGYRVEYRAFGNIDQKIINYIWYTLQSFKPEKNFQCTWFNSMVQAGYIITTFVINNELQLT